MTICLMPILVALADCGSGPDWWWNFGSVTI